jgi:hypothetical protein
MKKTPAVRGTAGVLIRSTILRRLDELGAEKASGSHDFDPNAFPNLYKIAHCEWAVEKSNNSTSGLSANMLARAMFDVGYFPPNTPPARFMK